MLKFIFWLLLGVNALLFALGQGYLGNGRGNEREPGRMKNQINREGIILISQATATAAVAASASGAQARMAPASKPAAKPQQVIACTEIGNFASAEARRFEARLAPLALGERQSRHPVPGQEISSYIVHLPPQGSKEDADKKTDELKQLGVANYIISDNSALRWAISLGVFKSEAGAQNLLASLAKQGVPSVRIAPRMTNSKQLAFQFRDLATDTKAGLDQIKAAFPAQEMRSCK